VTIRAKTPKRPTIRAGAAAEGTGNDPDLVKFTAAAQRSVFADAAFLKDTPIATRLGALFRRTLRNKQGETLRHSSATFAGWVKPPQRSSGLPC
jgi:hypothetical protein